jgi:excisionase family DNA binding protein
MSNSSAQPFLYTPREAAVLLYSPSEAAKILGICRASVYNLIGRGELRAVKLGRSTRISVAELHRLAGGSDGTP